MDIDIIGSILRFMPPEELLYSTLSSFIASKSILLHYPFTPDEIETIGAEVTKDNIITLSKNVSVDHNVILILTDAHQYHDVVVKIISGHTSEHINNTTISSLLQHNCQRGNIEMVKFLLPYVKEYDYKKCIKSLNGKDAFDILYWLIDKSFFPEVLFNYAINKSGKLGAEDLSNLLNRYPDYKVSIKNFTIFDRETCTILSKCHRVNHTKSKSSLLPYSLINGWYNIAKNILTPVARGLNPRIDHGQSLIVLFSTINDEMGNEDDILDIVRILMSLGLDPLMDNSMCLTRAIDNNSLKGVMLLLEDFRINPSNWNNAPIKSAVGGGHLKIVKLLLGDKRVNLWACFPRIVNSLFVSSKKSIKHQETLVYILGYLGSYIKHINMDSIDINAVLSPVFMHACKHENLSAIKILSPLVTLSRICKRLCSYTYENVNVISYLLKLKGFDPTCDDRRMLKNIIRNGKWDVYDLMLKDQRIKVKESDLIYCVHDFNILIAKNIFSKGSISRLTIEKVITATNKQRQGLNVYKMILTLQKDGTFNLDDQIYFMIHNRLFRVLYNALKDLGVYKEIKSTRLRDVLKAKYKGCLWFHDLV